MLWADTFPEDEARSGLPFLRVRVMARRRGAARACKRLGLTAALLAEKISAHESVLSRARHGELPTAHRAAIHALLQ